MTRTLSRDALVTLLCRELLGSVKDCRAAITYGATETDYQVGCIACLTAGAIIAAGFVSSVGANEGRQTARGIREWHGHGQQHQCGTQIQRRQPLRASSHQDEHRSQQQRWPTTNIV